MQRATLGFLFLLLPISSSAAVCDQVWFHLAGVSKHIEVYEPNQYTRYKRQTHPGVGLECQLGKYNLSAGEFKNSLDRPFRYATAAKDIFSIKELKLYAGVLAGEYGRTELEPLRLVSPVVYLEYHYKYLGINFFALPPARGFNDYAIFFAQFKVGF